MSGPLSTPSVEMITTWPESTRRPMSAVLASVASTLCASPPVRISTDWSGQSALMFS